MALPAPIIPHVVPAAVPVACPPPASHIRGLQRDLVEAGDIKIRRVVAMVDQLAERGNADALIAPLRGRLAQLRPSRPLRMVRLLFTPLDPLVLPGAKWRRGTPGIPRSVLACLGDVVLGGLGQERALLEARLAGATSDQAATIAEAGGSLWPLAADILATAPPPADWSAATGLQPTDYQALSRAIAALFGQVAAMHRMIAAARSGTPPSIPELEELMAALVPAGADAVAMMTCLLMARLPRTDTVASVSDDLAVRHPEPAFRTAADRAVDFMLDRIEASLRIETGNKVEPSPGGGPDLARAAAEIGQTVTMLDDLDDRAAQRPTRRARIEQLKRRLDGNCRTQFAGSLEARLLQPATGLACASAVEITALEAAARDLRQFEGQARRLGGGDQYDRSLAQAARSLHPAGPEPPMVLVDRARLVEILQGPDAAFLLLAEASPVPAVLFEA